MRIPQFWIPLISLAFHVLVRSTLLLSPQCPAQIPQHTPHSMKSLVTESRNEERRVVAFELVLQIFLYVWGISNTQIAKSRVGKSNLVLIYIKILEVGGVVV